VWSATAAVITVATAGGSVCGACHPAAVILAASGERAFLAPPLLTSLLPSSSTLLVVANIAVDGVVVVVVVVAAVVIARMSDSKSFEGTRLGHGGQVLLGDLQEDVQLHQGKEEGKAGNEGGKDDGCDGRGERRVVYVRFWRVGTADWMDGMETITHVGGRSRGGVNCVPLEDRGLGPPEAGREGDSRRGKGREE